jgi:hypothetical protein
MRNNTSRIPVNDDANSTKPQSETNASSIIPQSLAIEAKRALDELNRAGAEATMLLMMVADNLSEGMDGYSPCDKSGVWEQFAGFEFSTAAPLGLAIKQIVSFRAHLDLWKKKHLSMIESASWNPSGENLEMEILELNALLSLQVNALEHQYNFEEGAPIILARSVIDRLRSAFTKSHCSFSTLRQTVDLKQAS